MPNTSISFPASPAVNDSYTYGTTQYIYTGTNWAISVNSPSLPAFITSANIVDGTIVNADISANAAIDSSKISPVFTSASTFSSTLGVTGATTLSSTLDVTGNLTVNTNKFTVAASSGNTLAAGTLTATGGVTPASLTSKIQPITASVAASALTITLNPTILDFRSSTLTSGTVTTVVVPAAISLTIPSGATIGTVNNVQSRIMVLAINNAGTVELAAVNISGGSSLNETTLITTVTNASGGNSATAYYSTTARSNVAYRVVGYVESTQATAGTWATAPSTIQGMGGQALTAQNSIGYGQTWQNPVRSPSTTYYNTTGKPIMAHVYAQIQTINLSTSVNITVGGVLLVLGIGAATLGSGTASFIIPAGVAYSYTNTNINGLSWYELR